jgi:hypothetical protein
LELLESLLFFQNLLRAYLCGSSCRCSTEDILPR